MRPAQIRKLIATMRTSMIERLSRMRVIPAAVAIAAALALGGCLGDDEEEADTTPTATEATTAPDATTPKGAATTQKAPKTTTSPSGTPKPGQPSAEEIEQLGRCLQQAGKDQKKIQACIDAVR